MRHFFIACIASALAVGAIPTSSPVSDEDLSFEFFVDHNAPVDEIQTLPGQYNETRPPTNDDEEVHGEAQIVGGYVARPGEFPSTVALIRNGRHHCGAVLINSITVVTAAHCFYDELTGQPIGGNYHVRAGSNVSKPKSRCPSVLLEFC